MSTELQNPSTPTLPRSFWSALESVPGGSAFPTTWRQHLGVDLETFQSLFLRSRPDTPADAVPCPWNCGCSHKVVPRGNGTLAGICQCSTPHCGEYTVLPEEVIPWELDWTKIPRVLCAAFDLQPKTVKLGLYNTLQIGSWPVLRSAFDKAGSVPRSVLDEEGPALHSASGEGGSEIPAILTLASNPVEFLNIVAVLVSRFARPFILFAPTARHIGPSAKELLSNIGAAFFALEDNLQLTHSRENLPPDVPVSDEFGSRMNPESLRGTDHSSRFTFHALACSTPPRILFADIAPLLPDPSDEELARRACMVIDTLDSESRRKKPSLLTVFRLYCAQEMTVAQIAQKCRCSKATVSNRLSLLQSKIGVAPARLRRVSGYFTKFHEDMSAAREDFLESS